MLAKAHRHFCARLPLRDSVTVRVARFNKGGNALNHLVRDIVVHSAKRTPVAFKSCKRIQQVAGVPSALCVALLYADAL